MIEKAGMIMAYNPVAIDLGGIQVYWYALLILTGIIVATVLSIYEGKKLGIETNTIFDIILYGVPISIVGTRLYYVLFNLSEYDSLIDVINITEGGLAIHGGIISAFIFGYVFAKIKKLSLPLLVDLAAPAFLIAQAIGRWGNFMNQEAHGPKVPGETIAEQTAYLKSRLIPDFIIEQMNIGGVIYHPTFLYESIWNIIGFIVLLILRRTKMLFIGDLALIYVIWYSLGRFFIEALRTDSLMLGNIKVAQLISVLGILLGIIIIAFRHIYRKNSIYYHEVLEANGIDGLRTEETEFYDLEEDEEIDLN